MLRPNIDKTGRSIRALGGFVSLVAATVLYLLDINLLSALLLVLGFFMLFEAARGWCALRACGIKTRV